MISVWIGFIAFVLLMLALDLGVFHRKSHVVSVREALGWSAVWISMGLSFSVFVYFAYAGQWFGLGTVVDAVDGLTNSGATATEKYLTGYVVEKSLSVDNIFVIAMIFSFFAVPPLYQHRVLFWGIIGALVLRGAMIGDRSRVNRRVPLDSLLLRRIPDPDRFQDALSQYRGRRSEQEHRRARDTSLLTGDRQVPRRALFRSCWFTAIVRERVPWCADDPG